MAPELAHQFSDVWVGKVFETDAPQELARYAKSFPNFKLVRGNIRENNLREKNRTAAMKVVTFRIKNPHGCLDIWRKRFVWGSRAI